MANEWLNHELTWYRGSIRPYASLWSTLIRLGMLNRMRLCELPDRTLKTFDIQKLRQTWYPLFNDHSPIDIVKLAQALGEPPEIFEWSQLARVQPWLRAYFSNQLRFCRACLQEGYHSSLFSLLLLRNCPVHGELLIDACTCASAFAGKQTSYDFAHYEKCACPAGQAIALGNWRQPTLDPTKTQLLEPVARFLDDLSLITISERSFNTPLPLPLICAAFAVTYPAILSRPSDSPVMQGDLTVIRGGPFPARRDTQTKPEFSSKSSYRMGNPTTWTYRAICRYIRRHVIQRRNRLMPEDAFNANHLLTLHKVRSQPRFVTAFTEMQWTRQLEKTIFERRRPYRKPSNDPVSGGRVKGELHVNETHIDLPKWCAKTSAVQWMQYHWASHTLLHDWLKVSAQTQFLLSWTSPQTVRRPATASSWPWAVQLIEGEICTFVEQFHERVLVPYKPINSKQDRVDAVEARQMQISNAMLQECSASCLTWTVPEGWQVTSAYAPTKPALKRHTLLGVPERKTVFWLYCCDGLFVARLCATRLQATGTTPKQAIDQLRNCYRHYRRHTNNTNP